jgi:16S rRNA (uracil1498-N3)-methyltransferase
MRRRFFVDHFDGHSAELHGHSADHLGRVLRAQRGQEYELSDGASVWLARVAQIALGKAGHSRIDFELIEPVAARQPDLTLKLLVSLIKFDRFEWCLEKATELGVAEVTPLIAARSDRPLIAAALKRAARWEKILLESAQQSRRLHAPILRKAIRASRAFGESAETVKILLSERADARPMRERFEEMHGNSVALAIGPEGGWTEEEWGAAHAAGFLEVSLGETILRTETAAIAAVAVIRFALGGNPRLAVEPEGR